MVNRVTGTSKLHDLFLDIVDAGLLEDRREFVQVELKAVYDLTDEEADDLYWMIQNEFDKDGINDRMIATTEPELIKEAIVEGNHSGWDGWTEHEWIVIRRYQADIVRYAKFAR
jgi:hypothetical protein